MRTFLVNFRVAGTNFVDNLSDISEGLKEGAELTLAREPQNKHDRKAIRLQDSLGRKIGYVPKTKNEVINNLLAGGSKVIAQLKYVEWEDNYLVLGVGVYLVEVPAE